MSLRRYRGLAAFLFGLLGTLLVVGGGLLSYGARQAFDSDKFADMAASSLADPRVSNYVANQIVDVVLSKDPDLIRVRPLLQVTANTVVASAPFRAIARRTIRRSHELALTNSGQEVLLTVSDLSLILQGALDSRPDLAKRIPPDVSVTLAVIDDNTIMDIASHVMQMGKNLRGWGRRTFLLGSLLLILSIIMAKDFRYALLRVGIALIVASLLLLLGVELGAPFLQRLVKDKELADAIGGVWDTFLSRLRPRALILGGIGLLMSAASTALLQRMDLRALQRSLARLLWEPAETRTYRVLRAFLYLAVGWMAILEPTDVARLLVILTGGLTAFIGLQEFFLVAIPEVEKVAASSATNSRGRGWHYGRRLLVGVTLVALAVAGGIFFTRPESFAPVSEATTTCNGSPALCDKTLDQVVFPAAHNAMGASDVNGWMFPNHTYGIPTQLQRGIRAFLVDVYPGYAVGERVKTDLEEGLNISAKFEPVLGVEGVVAATRIRDRLIVGADSPRKLYMCHGMCEIGASEFVAALAEIRRFLILNPGEVILVMIEDYVTPEEIAAAFEESRLIDLVYKGAPGPPWPTLGEMVQTGQRVLVVAENNASGVAWYHQAFEIFQETPYHTTDAAQFSCEPNRGGTRGSLLLVNHWVVKPPTSGPSDAAVVNAYDFLLDRVRRCQEARGKTANLIAVDFFDIGDLLRVTDTLNGITRSLP